MNNTIKEWDRGQMFEIYIDIDWVLKNKKRLEQM